MAGIYRRGGVWWGRVQHKGKDYRQSLETGSKTVAEKRLEKFVAELKAGKWGDGAPLTFNALADRFIKEHLPSLRPSAAKRYGVSIVWLDERLGEKTLQQIGKAELIDYETWRRGMGVSPPTIRRDLACLSSIFSFAEDRDLHEGNPVKAFLKRGKQRGLREAEARRRYLSRAEEIALLGKAVPHVRAAIVFAIYSGLRLKEQFTLSWRNVDMQNGTVRIHARDAKGKRTRDVVLLEPALDVLRKLPRHIKSDLVFWHRDGEPFLHLDRGFKGAARRAKVTDVRWHDLRRTHGCRLIQEHSWPLEMVRDQLGHSGIAVTEKTYAFLELDDRLKRAGNRAGTDAATTDEAEAVKALKAKAHKKNAAG